MKNQKVVTDKNHAYDYLYAYAAKIAGERELHLTDNIDFIVSYVRTSYCLPTDTVDSAIDKYIVECRFGDGRVVKFVPVSIVDDVLGHVIYYTEADDTREICTMGPFEWDVIKPKVYLTFNEYFEEINNAMKAYKFLYATKACDPFILNYYASFFQSFKDFIYGTYNKCDGKYFSSTITFDFFGEWFGSSALKEIAMMSKMNDGNLMLGRYSLN